MSGVRVAAAVATRELNLELDLPEGSLTAVVGPNGAGKTTLLHLIAGLVRPTSGTVSIGEQVVSGPRVFLAPHRRRAVLLTQDTALFPHLDVLDNVAFGPRSAGASRSAARARAHTELAAVGCAELASKRAGELSGGQAQRVAIARALATDPEIVLLDEPLAGLDIAAAAEVRQQLGLRLKGRTAVLVTHEVLDLWTIADRVAVIDHGRVIQAGEREQLHRPTSRFLAEFGGTNLLTGYSTEPEALRLESGLTLRGLADPAQPPVPGRAALATFDPAAVSLHLAAPGGSPRNSLAVVVSGIEPRGALVRVHLRSGDQVLAADLTASAVAELGLHPGLPVQAVVKATQVRLFGELRQTQ